jgi:hypothetical protein
MSRIAHHHGIMLVLMVASHDFSEILIKRQIADLFRKWAALAGSPEIREQRLEWAAYFDTLCQGEGALSIEDLVTDFGCLLAGTASTVDDALKLIRTVPIDGALIE